MRILHIALNNLRQDALCNALASMGEYEEIDWMKCPRHSFQQLVLLRAQEFKPDITFMQLQGPGVILPETAKQMPGFLINWTGDVRQPLPQWYIDLGKVINLTLFSNTADVKVARKAGVKADYLQTGFDQNIFKPGTSEKIYDIVFMGNNYPGLFPLSNMRSEMIDFLRSKYGDRFKLYGKGWPTSNGNCMFNQKIEADIYHITKIAINLSHFDLPHYSSDRNLRIMGSGAFCLSYPWPGLKDEFSLSQMGLWSDFKELAYKIDFFLTNEKTREEKAARGCEHVHKNCTWDARIKELKRLIKKYQ